MAGELDRDVALEANRRGARVNPHELWVLLGRLGERKPGLVVDVTPDPAAWWAWWTLGARVIGVSTMAQSPVQAFGTPHFPANVCNLVGDPRDLSTVLRARDQLAGDADVLVLGGPHAVPCFNLYTPLVSDFGLVVVQGIADPASPDVQQFWARQVWPGRCRELIGETNPVGYGVMEISGRDREHG